MSFFKRTKRFAEDGQEIPGLKGLVEIRGQGLAKVNQVKNDLTGVVYAVSTVRKFRLSVWETVVFESLPGAGFSTDDFLFITFTFGNDDVAAILAQHTNACAMAKSKPVAQWRMTSEAIQAAQRDASVTLWKRLSSATFIPSRIGTPPRRAKKERWSLACGAATGPSAPVLDDL